MFYILVLLVGLGLGYGFRGLISRNKNKIGADVKADVTKVDTAVKTDLKKL